MIKIVWVEDQFHWIERFKSTLENANFSILENSEANQLKSTQKNKVEVFRFEEAARHAINNASKQTSLGIPDIVILDANMNGDNDAGLGLSKLINKTWPKVPIIFLSEHSGTSTEEKVFESSQTRDFIAKHQDNIENVLCWRIKALLRNAELNKQNDNPLAEKTSSNQMRSSELLIDLVTWNVYWQGEKLMNPKNPKRPLAPTPRKILKHLVEASPRPVSTGQMEQNLELDRFNYASYRQHIKTLRHSFENASKIKGSTSFLEVCQQGRGIVTFGDDGAYCWKAPTSDKN